MSALLQHIRVGTFVGLSVVTPPLAGYSQISTGAVEWKPISTLNQYETASAPDDYSLGIDYLPEEITINSYKTITIVSTKLVDGGRQKAYPLEDYNRIQEV